MDNAFAEIFQKNIKDRQQLMTAKRKTAKKLGLPIPTNSELIGFYNDLVRKEKIKADPRLERILRRRAVRTLSGIAPVAVLTKPVGCPGKCAYCPTEKDVPQSYLSNEPAVMRAIRCGYDPYVQVMDRLRALEANGHRPGKIELIVIGGTWSYFPAKYKFWYIASCFAAANRFGRSKTNPVLKNKSLADLKKILEAEQKKNETAKYRIIGLTLETRPDYINENELREMRELGCTRVEIGVQAIDNAILKKNRRGSTVEDIAKATALLKDFGFKVTYHIMPGLPGSSKAKDIRMYRRLFSDSRFQPDQIKFYPTVVTKGSLLYRWWKQGKYKPYTDEELRDIIISCKQDTPPYVRIIRLIRDIPGESIVAGNKVTNLRQIIKDQGVECGCIRCREPKDGRQKGKMALRRIEYQASGGREIFLSYESTDRKTLFGFCRLRLPGTHEKAALIRELHVYGELVPVGGSKQVQHAGLGRKLLAEAEKTAKKQGYREMLVISGIGVRGYYRKSGYRLKSGYMAKKLV